MSVYCLMVHSSATGAGDWPTYPKLSAPARGAPDESSSNARRLGVGDLKRLTRAERRSIRYTQLQLSLLNRRKKRVTGGWVSLEVDKSVRASIEAHMRRSK